MSKIQSFQTKQQLLYAASVNSVLAGHVHAHDVRYAFYSLAFILISKHNLMEDWILVVPFI